MPEPLSDVESAIDRWERDAERKAARYREMTDEVERISITGSAASGAVTVTVGANGIPDAVTMTDGVRKLSPDRIAAAVMEAMTRAQSRYPERLAAIMAQTVGDDATTRHLVATAQAGFPHPEGQEPPPPRPPRDGDDDDFSGDSYLSGGR
ncbi:DNA-binding protein YbaB [Saccharothrix tamanrassetensis]|uniref:DNA-binding protein YbaB n=1 Tax=Saccharothrix tamanrassetensis TaxID=1051531 RepID=A0A841CLW5_9PSEU|nr:YbaB/EbfC family nucleoid-associated protein [Saccharothrix tamanrassetensis]MBB5958100.1 DNA-binding protein YbaB [Saccharothrix tamanrassetensis]